MIVVLCHMGICIANSTGISHTHTKKWRIRMYIVIYLATSQLYVEAIVEWTPLSKQATVVTGEGASLPLQARGCWRSTYPLSWTCFPAPLPWQCYSRTCPSWLSSYCQSWRKLYHSVSFYQQRKIDQLKKHTLYSRLSIIWSPSHSNNWIFG